MKKHASSKFTKTRISKITKDSPSTDPYQHVQTPVEVPIFGLELNSRVLPKNAPIRAADDRVGPRGPTSFSAIFADNQADLGSGLWDVETEIVRDHDFCSSEKIRSTTTAQKDLHLGMKVLSVIPDRTRCFALMDRYFTAFHPMDPILHQPTVKLWYDGLWGFFDRYFGESREPKKLRGMVQRICKNQQGRTDPKVLKDYERWVAAFTGPCLRWETVGILFAISGIACMTHPAWDKARNSTHDHLGRSTFAQQMLSCVRDCLRLCDSFEDVNDLSVYLLYLHLTLRFMCGEEGARPWDLRAQIVSAATELGLHHRKETDIPTSFLLSQLRKRTFAACFTLDKLMSTHLGRPPSLSRHYCSTQLPFDFNDDRDATDPVEVISIQQGVDNSGWDAAGNVFPSTYLRAMMFMSGIRDSILEVFLGSVHGSIGKSVDNLRLKLEHAYANLPAQIKNEPRPIAYPIASPAVLMQQIFISLEYKYNLYLLERIPTNSSIPSQRKTLLSIAQNMLHEILAMWSRRDFMVEFQWQFVCVIKEYGISSAGVLCIELLRPTQQPPQPLFQTTHPTNINPPISRAQLILNLSLFVSCLEWIPAEILNLSKVCDRFSIIIKRILDRVLSPTTVNNNKSVTTNASMPPHLQPWLLGTTETQPEALHTMPYLDIEASKAPVEIEDLADLIDFLDFSD